MSILDSLYHYKFRVDRIIDGDTIVGKLDKGCKNFDEDVKIRLLGIQAPEISKAKTQEEKERGEAARVFLEQLIAGKTLVVNTVKDKDDDSFGRMLATVWLPGDTDLNVCQYMIDNGHAVVYTK